MAKRLIDCSASEIKAFTKEDKLSSIAASEGRVIACESIGIFTPMLGDISNVEFLSSLGTDILLLNIFDVDNPLVNGLPAHDPQDTVRLIKKLTGKLVGINLEPVPDNFISENENNPWKISEGRKASLSNAKKALEMGVDFILLTGNPGNGVSNSAICNSLRELKEAVGDDIILGAGKMHASEVLSESGENIISKEDVKDFIDAGADIVLFPAPGTVPGISMEFIKELVALVHGESKLAMTSIGTSQEGADEQTIRQIALMCKMAGTDIHHLGDSAYTGMSLPENVMAYSITIRGRRHTYRRMALSLNR